MQSNEERAGYGYAALEAGTSDRGQNSSYEGDPAGVRTDAVDTIANVLHHLFQACAETSLDARELFALSALDAASVHFRAELRGEL